MTMPSHPRRTHRDAIEAHVLCAALVVAGLPGFARAAEPVDPASPALTLDAQVSADLDRITGRAVWRYVNRDAAPLPAVHFDLRANRGASPDPHRSQLHNSAGFYNAWAPSSTRIDGVTVDGAPVELHFRDAPAASQTHALERGVLVVPLAAPLAPGAAVEIAIDFATEVPHRQGDEGHFDDTLIWRFGWFPQPRVRSDGRWSEQDTLGAFTHHAVVKGPADHLVVLGGQTAEVGQGTGRAEAAVPVRSVPLVVTADARLDQRTEDGVTANVLLRPDGAVAFDPTEDESARTHAVLRQVLADFGAHYGPSRLRTVHVVELPIARRSMAADGLLLMSDLFYIFDDTLIADGMYARVFEMVMAHEMAHQWFGLGAGVAFDDSNWLSEGLAQLMAHGYGERRFGRDGADGFDPSIVVAWYEAATRGELPPEKLLAQRSLVEDRVRARYGLDDPVVAPAERIAHHEDDGPRLYHTGLVVARTLYALIGEAETARLLAAAARRFEGQIMTVDGLVALAGEQGHDLSLWADAIVRGGARVDVALDAVEPDAGGTTVRIRRSGPAIPIPVAAYFGDAVVRATVPADGDSVRIERAGVPDEVIVDPDGWVPDVRRDDNRWGSNVTFAWLAPRPQADTHAVAVNPLPLSNTHGLLGLSANGASERRWGWRAGFGLLGFTRRPVTVDEDVGPQATTSLFYGGAAGAWWRPSRGQRIGLDTSALRIQSDYTDGIEVTTSLPWSWAVYTALPSTTPGVTEHPRFVFTLRPGFSVWRIEPEVLEWPEPYTRPWLGGSVALDALPDLGLIARLWARGSLLDIGGDEIGGSASASIDYTTRLPWFGGLRAGLTGAGSTAADPNPALDRLIVYAPTDGINDLFADGLAFGDGPRVAGPYAHGISADVRWRIPLLRDARILNLLTFDIFIFDELGIELHAAGAWGVPPAGDAEVGPLAEVGAALDIGLATFSGLETHIAIGAGRPVLGAEHYPEPGWVAFGRLGLGVP